MNTVFSDDAHKSSRLIQFLTDRAVSSVKVSHKHFAEELGQMIDLSDSFALSDALRGLKKTPYSDVKIDKEQIKTVFLQQQHRLVETMIGHFSHPVKGSPMRLPAIDKSDIDLTKTLEGYQRFYALQQSDLESQIIQLRHQLRQDIKGFSPRLAQLVALDTIMSDTLGVHSRQLFNLMPRILSKRFADLQSETSSSQNLFDDELHWLEAFQEEMQGLLLAELEVRLQPLLGLIEALDEEL